MPKGLEVEKRPADMICTGVTLVRVMPQCEIVRSTPGPNSRLERRLLNG